MLVLARRLNEKIVLPGLGITVQVVAIKGGTVRIGINAPPDVPIQREELRVPVRPKNGVSGTRRTLQGK